MGEKYNQCTCESVKGDNVFIEKQRARVKHTCCTLAFKEHKRRCISFSDPVELNDFVSMPVLLKKFTDQVYREKCEFYDFT